MKLNKKGFTLIELLAVITIMGILMLVAIPAVSRTIENSRRDTFADLAKQYISTVRNAVLADELDCGGTSVGATANGTYYFKLNTNKGTTDSPNAEYQQTIDIMEKAGKSSWSSADVEGYVQWIKTSEGEKTRTTYSILLVDTGKHGIDTLTAEEEITRAKVSTATSKYANAPSTDSSAQVGTPADATAACTLK